MSKVAIVYIGPKETKRDTITGSRQVFPRMTPIEIEESLAANLLRFSKVFVEADKLDEVKKQQEEADQAKAEQLAQEIANQQAAAIEADYSVTVNGEEYDLKKMNCSKIAALLEGSDLDVEAKGSQESAEDYKLRVRDTIRSSGESE